MADHIILCVTLRITLRYFAVYFVLLRQAAGCKIRDRRRKSSEVGGGVGTTRTDRGGEYGRPSLTLDLIEEFRPVIADSLTLNMINKKMIRSVDFYKPEDKEPAAFDFAETDLPRGDLPIILTHQGMKKFIVQFEAALNRKTMYLPTGKRLTFREIFLEQVRLFVRHIKGEAEYTPYQMK